MAYIKVPKIGKRTEFLNKEKPFLGYRPGRGMPSCHEPNMVEDKEAYDKTIEETFGKRTPQSFQTGKTYKIKYKNGKRCEEIK